MNLQSKAATNKFFNGDCEFIIGASKIEQIPNSNLPEIAFIGKSNVGKSSLINNLVNRKIAITSKTPGRTRQLNIFCLNKKLNIVDMPGYGYAKIGKKHSDDWSCTRYDYFSNRKNLKLVFLLIDARRGIDEKDEEIIDELNRSALNHNIILTKIDQLKNSELEKILMQIKTKSIMPILVSSSRNYIGINEIRKIIKDIL